MVLVLQWFRGSAVVWGFCSGLALQWFEDLVAV